MTPTSERKIAWVTSASSFLGCHVARNLASDGWEVIGFSRRGISDEQASVWGFSRIESGDFGSELLSGARDRYGPPAIVFHAIGTGSVGQANANEAADFERTFVSAEILMTHLARGTPPLRVIYPSSAAVYGGGLSGPISEQTPLNPFSVYGKTKALTEQMCRDWATAAGIELIIARFFSIYGSPQRKLLLWDLGQRLLSGEDPICLGGTGNETRDFLHAEDAAMHVGRLAQHAGLSGIFNIGSGIATSTRHVATVLRTALGSQAEIVFDGVLRPGDPLHQQANIARLSTLSPMQPIPLREGLRQYADWLRVTSSL